MTEFLSFIGGMAAAAFLAAILSGHSQTLDVKRGFFVHDQKLYVITPAKPVSP